MKTKQVCQLDKDGYFVGLTVADESPLEPNVFLFPAGSVDAEPPLLTENTRAKWVGQWIVEEIPPPPPPPEPNPLTSEQLEELNRMNRQGAYQMEADPLFFKAQRGEATMDEWLSKILEIKLRFPKP